MKDSSDSSPSEQGFDNPLVKFDKHRLLNTPSEISQRANMMEFGQYGALAQKIILETIDHADHAWSFVVQFDCLEKGSEFRIVHPGNADNEMIAKLQKGFSEMPSLNVTERIAFQLQVSIDPERLK
jgi:hypothetical protein